jgi:hypothetical protein
MQTYKFDADTKEYLYAEEAFRDPLESKAQGRDVWLLPADSTFTAPLEPKDGNAVCWNGDAWEYKEDHRQKRDKGGMIVEDSGTPYWLKGDTWESPARYMTELGKLPDGALLVKPEKSLGVLREEKLSALNAAFASVESGAWVMSSLGFKADANTTANTNIEGLIKSMSALGQETVIFCDYDNVYREVTLEGLQTLQLEVIQNGQSLYAQKWVFRNAINVAKDKDALDAVQVEFSMMNFSA